MLYGIYACIYAWDIWDMLVCWIIDETMDGLLDGWMEVEWLTSW